MPNFQNVSDLGTLKPFTKMEPGEICVTYGEFIGVSENQYGKLFNFMEVESGERVTIPKCGKLLWMHGNGTLKEGFRYQVKYLGKDILDKGTYKGKEFNDVEVLEDWDYAPAGHVAAAKTEVQEDDLLG